MNEANQLLLPSWRETLEKLLQTVTAVDISSYINKYKLQSNSLLARRQNTLQDELVSFNEIIDLTGYILSSLSASLRKPNATAFHKILHRIAQKLDRHRARVHSVIQKLVTLAKIKRKKLRINEELCWRYNYGLLSLVSLRSQLMRAIKCIDSDSQLRCSIIKMIELCDLNIILVPPLEDKLYSRIAENLHQLIPVKVSRLSMEKSVKNYLTNILSLRRRVVNQMIDCDEALLTTKGVPAESMSLENFQNYIDCQIPVLIHGAITHWTCFKDFPKMSLPYAKLLRNQQYFDYQLDIFMNIYTQGYYRNVPVEIGQSYTHKSWTQTMMPLGRFMMDYLLTGHYLNKPKKRGYLAMHNLFDQIPQLRKIISIPDYCSCQTSPSSSPNNDLRSNVEQNEIEINAWLGPANTVTPLHFDEKDNLFAQLVGLKLVILCSKLTPKAAMYAHPKRSLLPNTSRVNPENIKEKYHLFKEAQLIYILIKPGDLLFIPKGWWHYVRSITPSLSVSYWW